MPGYDLLGYLLQVSNDDVRHYAEEEEISEERMEHLRLELLTHRLGKSAHENLPEREKRLLDLHILGGCCGHKDLNAFKYGAVEMSNTWEVIGKEPPVLLANKANDATIRLGQDADTAAIQNAIESSSRGGVKLASLAGSLFNNKIEGKGYQDIHNNFMREKKQARFVQGKEKKFPDTSNVRYQSHSYAAAELVTFHDLYLVLIELVGDSKHKPGLNHVESNVLKGLKCAATVTELVALALYGVSVSWPYLRAVRGEPGSLINLLDLVDLHRKIPLFCEQLAADPLSILSSDTDLTLRTLDGLAIMDEDLVCAASQLVSELPDLPLILSAMFRGAAHGWRRFTEEFVPGGVFDSLTNEERGRVFIPSTNDANEGALGSFRVFIRYHPHATVASFANQARVQRNNTEKFIIKHCTQEDHQYVMREVRRLEAQNKNTVTFQQKLINSQEERARNERQRRLRIQQKRQVEIDRLVQVGLIGDRNHILSLSVKQLGDQLQIYRKILKDPVLVALKLKEIPTKVFMQSAVLAALSRNESTILALQNSLQNLPDADMTPESDAADDLDSDDDLEC
ncbi:hypothetical protein ONZ45_g19654 [Pleurotus djamor]|nr:hypothetical protein ONZ45_g19654 [Pleurotus djamor]